MVRMVDYTFRAKYCKLLIYFLSFSICRVARQKRLLSCDCIFQVVKNKSQRFNKKMKNNPPTRSKRFVDPERNTGAFRRPRRERRGDDQIEMRLQFISRNVRSIERSNYQWRASRTWRRRASGVRRTGIPRTTSKKKRRKSVERDRVADWLDSRQEVHTLPVIQVIQRYGNWSEWEV